jgi:galactokinase
VRLLAAFHENYPDYSPDYMLHVPERAMWVIAAITDSRKFDLLALESDGRVVFTYQSAKVKRTVKQRPLPGWSRFPAGVMVTLENAGFDLTGLVAVIGGEESLGTRYDYSLGMTVAALFHKVNDQPYTMAVLLEITDRVRREYIER